jgi:hypothetical protein
VEVTERIEADSCNLISASATGSAAIDRLVHHAIILESDGNSHRAKAFKENVKK